MASTSLITRNANAQTYTFKQCLSNIKTCTSRPAGHVNGNSLIDVLAMNIPCYDVSISNIRVVSHLFREISVILIQHRRGHLQSYARPTSYTRRIAIGCNAAAKRTMCGIDQSAPCTVGRVTSLNNESALICHLQ